jgi:glyoxylase-like metal-dependent hydrolase (beta-lactamase superfamily II)
MKIHNVRGYIQSLYLVEYDDKLLLLDSGCRCDIEIIEKFIVENLKRPISDLKLIIVTHAHPDHSGGSTFLKKKFNIPIASTEKVNEFYSGLKGFSVYWIDILLTYMVARRKKTGFKNIIFPREIVIDYKLNDGDMIPGFEDWVALSCPGHTSSDLTIYHQETKTAYIADNIVSSRTSYNPPYPIIHPKKYKRSLKKYIDLGIENFLLAHYNENKISKGELENLIKKAPDIHRSHSNTLFKILKRLFG